MIDIPLAQAGWLHSLLQKAPLADIDPAACGFSLLASAQEASLAQLASLVNEELLLLCEAHFDRYYSQVDSLA